MFASHRKNKVEQSSAEQKAKIYVKKENGLAWYTIPVANISRSTTKKKKTSRHWIQDWATGVYTYNHLIMLLQLRNHRVTRDACEITQILRMQKRYPADCTGLSHLRRTHFTEYPTKVSHNFFFSQYMLFVAVPYDAASLNRKWLHELENLQLPKQSHCLPASK